MGVHGFVSEYRYGIIYCICSFPQSDLSIGVPAMLKLCVLI